MILLVLFLTVTIIQNILHVHSGVHGLISISKSRPQETFLAFYPAQIAKLGGQDGEFHS